MYIFSSIFSLFVMNTSDVQLLVLSVDWQILSWTSVRFGSSERDALNWYSDMLWVMSGRAWCHFELKRLGMVPYNPSQGLENLHSTPPHRARSFHKTETHQRFDCG